MQGQAYHKALLQLLLGQDRSLSRIYGAMARELAFALRKYNINSHSGVWFKNVYVRKEVEAILLRYHRIIFDHISANIRDAWALSDSHNDSLVNGYLTGISIDEKQRQKYYSRNTAALPAFIERGKQGFRLSDRLWQLTTQTREQLEYFIAAGLTEGRSAVKLSQDIRRYLKEPEKRFRRIRDPETGKLKLSAPAKNYHPGRGIYRSSYKNALRLARNEINIAYRTADHLRRQQLPFVTGIEVQLSPAHPKYDICDELQGKYPKDFMFTGWHPNCLCFTTAKLLPKAEFVKYLKGGTIDPGRQISALPGRAVRYLDEHSGRIRSLKSKPYFIKDNFKYSEAGYSLKKAILEV